MGLEAPGVWYNRAGLQPRTVNADEHMLDRSVPTVLGAHLQACWPIPQL